MAMVVCSVWMRQYIRVRLGYCSVKVDHDGTICMQMILFY